MTEKRLRDDALAIWKAGVAAVEADTLVRREVSVDDDLLRVAGLVVPLKTVDRIAVVGAGKATTAMARALEAALGPRLCREKGVGGWVNVPDATVERLGFIHVHGARRLPDNRPTAEGVEGSRVILDTAKALTDQDLLICLLSGGGSALLPLPATGLTLDDKLRVTALLQVRGASIAEMNCVRKHLSDIKGGRLAQATKAGVLTLLVSDVVGDSPGVIASGPTSPDATTFAEAVAVLDRFELRSHVPPRVLAHLEHGAAGHRLETLKTKLDRVLHVVLGDNETARHAAIAEARRRGFRTVDLGLVEGDTQVRAGECAARIRRWQAKLRVPGCLVDGGETTVSLPPGHGKGGRNQEFALAALDALGSEELTGTCLVCGGTDGEDGPTDAAGALADEDLARAAAAQGLDPADFLRRHDAYNFFAPLGGLVKTGPTNTNVMDLRVVLIDPRQGARVVSSAGPERKSLRARAKPR